ncbi:MAG: delta-60 repeat domain-containing protein [Bacteroidota bacterium]|jgi:uncharacterized delta-60 repeat protein
MVTYRIIRTKGTKLTTLLFILSFLLFACHLSGQSHEPSNRVNPHPGSSIISLTTSDDIANSLVIAPDGNMFVSGYTNSWFTLFKVTTGGRLDNTFGSKGMVKTSLKSGEDLLSSIVLLPDNKILVSGSAYNGTHNDFAMLKFLPQGGIDTTFGTKGMFLMHARGGNDIASSMALQPDGKIIVVGSSSDGNYDAFALARFKPEGDPDPSFGKNGLVVTDVRYGDDRISDLAVQPDGKIVVAGSSNTKLGVARYLCDGELDRSFGNNGITLTSVSDCEDIAAAIGLQGDGKIVVAGSSFNGESFNFTVVRYTTLGKPDASFGKGGIVITSLGDGDDKVSDLLVQPDGKLVAGGSTFNGQADDFALVRYNCDGSLDQSFGNKGIVITSVQKGDEHIYSLALQRDGKIVAAGNTNNGYNNDFIVLRFMPDGSLDPDFGR